MRPFVKWAGGKAQLAGTIIDLMPDKFQDYYEPFIGGGGVFFDLVTRGVDFLQAHLSDANYELINCYCVVRSSPDELLELLSKMPVDKETFLQVRAKDPSQMWELERAARTIYLNKTCFNGLYRVNKSGQFNAPWGNWKKPPTIADETNIQACSCALIAFCSRSISCVDFEQAVSTAGRGDVVYLDPPYVPLSRTSNFTGYCPGGFGEKDHVRLAGIFRQLVDRGALAILSNSDTEFTRNLYSDFEVMSVKSRRSINSKGNSRGSVGEIIVIGR